ncbi:MAG: HAD family hydrolase [Candidatus Eisenbacteria bacterium]
MLVLAIAGFSVWATRDLTKALEVTIATLVVTCPCAIGLAVPLAKELSLLALKRRGVFVRSQGLLDRAVAVRRVFFDKTGTLTLGRMTLDAAFRERLAELPAEERTILYEMSIRSNHPRSRAIVAALADLDTTDADMGSIALASDSISEHPGLGLECRHDQVYRLGRPSFVLGEDGARGDATMFGRDGVVLLSLTFDEELRGDASDEVARLQDAGLEIELLSGDSPDRTRKVAEQLGIAPEHAYGGLTPEEKSERVRALDRHDSLMVGDGLNDAAGLEVAFVAGTPAIDHPSLPARADFYFLGEGIAAVRLVLAAASQLHRVVRTNLTVAVAYNAFALALCFTGHVSPVSAAILMPISSIGLVLLTVYRMKGKEGVWTS